MDPTPRRDDPDRSTGDDYLDTVALLQEEIARLEAELRMRDEPASEDDAAPGPEPEGSLAASRRVEELTAALAERDECIGLLWEQLSALETSRAARSAEWDQLHRWVEELEARLEVDCHAGGGRGEADVLRDRMEAEERAWESHRRRLEDELASLRGRLDGATGGMGGDPALVGLEGENRRLRDECRRLAASEAEVEVSRDRARALQAELERAREELEAARHDLRNDRLQHAAELAAMRAGGVRAEPGQLGGDLAPHERIRAFREHLRELQEREDRERGERQLSTRISRLWQRSGPRK